jgi:APA family basic amino acid/polyamine antiporter
VILVELTFFFLPFYTHTLTVGVGWSGYFVKFFNVASYGRITFAESWTQPPLFWTENPASISYSGNYFNVPGFVITMLITLILIVG